MEHPRTTSMRTMRAQRALGLLLTVGRNPGITSRELEDAFRFSYRTLQRATADARAAGITLRSEDTGGDMGHRWELAGTCPPSPEANPVLVRWLEAIEKGGVDLSGMPEKDRVQWYQDVGKLMLVGTPPFSPTDHIDVIVQGKALKIVVPRGRSVNDTREYHRTMHRTEATL